MQGLQLSPYRGILLLAIPWCAFLGVVFRVTGPLVLAAAGVALLLLARGSAHGVLRGIEARRELYPSAFEGDAVAVELVVENRSRYAAHLVEIADAFGPAVADRQMALEPGPLPGARRRRLRYRTACSRPWGVYGVGPLVLRSADPLGLLAAERLAGQVEAFAVFPRVHDVAGVERLGARPSLTSEDVAAARPGQSPAYLGVRDYRAGDELRRIHWPVTARRGTPAVKEFEVDLTPYFTLFLDLDRRHRTGTGAKSTLEYVVRTAASLVWTATRRGHVVQVVGEGARPLFVPPGRGALHLAHSLFELIRVHQDGTTPLLDLVERYRPYVPEGSIAAVLSGTVAVDTAALEVVLEGFRAHGVRPLLVFVDSDSFVPIERWARPRAEIAERGEELLALLRGRGVPGAILGADHVLAEELARADLFGEA